MVSDKMICEDIVQVVFEKFFENWNIINNKQSAGFWLFKTARNEIYMHFRKLKVRKESWGTDDTKIVQLKSEDSVSENYELKEMRQYIFELIQNLPPEQKEVYLLKEYGGLSYAEISSILGIKEELVKSRLYKTRQKLIAWLGEKYLSKVSN